MEAQELHRGRLIDHVQLVVSDLARSRKFYAAVFDALGVPLGGEVGESFWYDELFISGVNSPEALGKLTGRAHIALQASSREMVDRFYRKGLEAGGIDNGAPGLRPYHPSYYAAFLLDPDQNNIEAVHHGPAERSAPSVKITF